MRSYEVEQQTMVRNSSYVLIVAVWLEFGTGAEGSLPLHEPLSFSNVDDPEFHLKTMWPFEQSPADPSV